MSNETLVLSGYGFGPIGTISIANATDGYNLIFRYLYQGGKNYVLANYRSYENAMKAIKKWSNIISDDFDQNLNDWAVSLGFANKVEVAKLDV